MTTICSRSLPIGSMAALARSFSWPRPVVKASRMPCRPRMKPPVGKSGPGTISRIFASGVSGFWISAMVASMISVRLCGGILVAMPTAMPDEPLISRFGHARRQHFRLLLAIVVIGPEIDGLFVDVLEQRGGDAGEPRLGVPRRPPADRHRPSRSCPGRRPADSAG